MQKDIDSSESFWTKENGIHALWSVLFLLCFLGVYVWMFFTIAEFQKLFRDFGADIFPQLNLLFNILIFTYFFMLPRNCRSLLILFVSHLRAGKKDCLKA